MSAIARFLLAQASNPRRAQDHPAAIDKKVSAHTLFARRLDQSQFNMFWRSSSRNSDRLEQLTRVGMSNWAAYMRTLVSDA